MLTFDYAQIEAAGIGWDVHVGLKFSDEPDELYVARVQVDGDGTISSPMLFFNGMDCRYEWRHGEREALERYIAEQLIELTR